MSRLSVSVRNNTVISDIWQPCEAGNEYVNILSFTFQTEQHALSAGSQNAFMPHILSYFNFFLSGSKKTPDSRWTLLSQSMSDCNQCVALSRPQTFFKYF